MPCDHWQPDGPHGTCSLGLYGGSPSPGVCRQCPRNTAAGQWPLVTLTTPADLPRTSPAALPVDRWPLLARLVYARRQPGEKGVGDSVARLVNARGGALFKAYYKRITGTSCGCSDRQARLNVLYPYV